MLRVKDDTKIVPAHGPLGTKAMIREYRQMLVDARERIQKLKAAGKSEDEVVAAKPNADHGAKFRLDERTIGNCIRVVYRSLKNYSSGAHRHVGKVGFQAERKTLAHIEPYRF